MQKIDDCKEIRLALTRAGIATRLEKCLQIFRLVVTAQYIYHNSSYVDDSNCLIIVSSLPFVYRNLLVSRHLLICASRNDSTVPTR
jgi:hypothetical protein